MKLKTIFLTSALLAALSMSVSAAEYTFDGPEDHLFGRTTSDETICEAKEINVDRSKNTALIPPGFGTPTSYLPGSGTHLTPNLVPGALTGRELVNSTGSVIAYPTVDTGHSPWAGNITAFTSVTDDLYYGGGHLGVLEIPAIGLNVKVYEGTDSSTLARGAGHFEETSIWGGNIAIAAHNRGTNAYFGRIHTLETGDAITLTTKLGQRTYSVTSVEKIRETDTSALAATADDRITLFTCVMDQREYRWCVRATAE